MSFLTHNTRSSKSNLFNDFYPQNNIKAKQAMKIEKFPFDESSKYLDSAFDEQKEASLSKKFGKHAKDQYKCYCTICLSQDPTTNDVTPCKMNRTIQSPPKNNQSQLNKSNEGKADHLEFQNFNKHTQQDQQEYNIKQDLMLTSRDQISNHDTELCFLLKRLQPPMRTNRSLRIFIPETVIFSNGEAKLLVFTSQKDNQLIFLKQRDKLQLNQLRKFFNENRNKYKQMIEQKLEEQRKFGVNESRYIKRELNNKSIDQAGALSKFGDKNTANNIKMNSRESFKLKPSNYPRSKTSENQDSTNVKHSMESQTSKGRNNSNKKKDGANNTIGVSSQNPAIPEREIKDAVVQKLDSNLNEGLEHTVVISETDFLILTMKRKVDPIWLHIHYLQNFLKNRKNKFEYEHFHFDYDELKDDDLFLRALLDIQILNGEISKVNTEYLNPEEEEELETKMMYEDSVQYQKYMTCKMFHFMQTFYSVTVYQMDTEWLQNDICQQYLINCKNIEYTTEARRFITTEQYFKKIQDQAEEKLKLREGMEEKYKNYRKQAIKMFSDSMLSHYESKKKSLGITKQKKTKEEVEISNEVFSKIYPSIPFKLSELLNTNAPIKLLQKEILGDKPPTIKDFTSSRNSQMQSNVYRSPIKQVSETTTLSFRQTIQILNKTTPIHNRGYSAHSFTRKRQYEGDQFSSLIQEDDIASELKLQDTKTNRSLVYESQGKGNNENIIDNKSSALKQKPTQVNSSSTSKQVIKVKKNSLPFFLFSPS